MRILVCGARNWSDYIAIRDVIASLLPLGVECIIEGEAAGADSMGRVAANELGIAVLKFPADWNKHGKAAGPIRNKQMLEEGKPDLILAFHDDIDKSKGTKNMLEQAQKAGIVTRLYSHKLVEKIIV